MTAGTTRVLGAAIPKELAPRNLTRKLSSAKELAARVDLKQVVKQIGDAAEQTESRSDDARRLAAQAKRLSRKLSCSASRMRNQSSPIRARAAG